MTQLNLEFYKSLLESTRKGIEGFQAIVDRERAEKEEALQLAGELEEQMAQKNARIAELETENTQLKTGFEAVEMEGLKEIGDEIEALHNAISKLNNPTQPVPEPEVEETEESEEAEETEIEEA